MPEAADLALALQDATDSSLVALPKWTKNSTGDTGLAMAGAVALNAGADMMIHYARILSNPNRP